MHWQSIVKKIHTWIGLICGAFLCLTCLSGSMAVFRPQLQAVFSPKVPPSGSQADLDSVVAKVLAKYTGMYVSRVLLPTADRNTFVLTLESAQANTEQVHLVVDAGTGAIAGTLNLPWLDWIIDFHHNLLVGRSGRRLVGGFGIVLFALSISGLVLSVLRRLSWRSFVTITSSGPRRRFYYELHRATGLWTYAFLTLLSFSGVALAYPDTFRSVFGRRTSISESKPSARHALRPLEDYLQISRVAEPSAQLTELRLPKSPKDPVSVRSKMRTDIGEVGRNELALDATGRILGERRLSAEPVGVQFQSALTPIHYGEVGGLAVRVLWSLSGVAPLVLFVSGFLVWLRKGARRDGEERRSQQDVRNEFLVTPRSF